MKNFVISLLFLFIIPTVMGKIEKTTYWNETLLEEVPKKEAVFKKTITCLSDKTVITEIKLQETDETIFREAFRGKEPMGAWIKKINDSIVTINYDFNLVYSEPSCLEDVLPQKLKLYTFDDPTYGYVAPRIATSETSLIEYMHKRIFTHYPTICTPDSELSTQRVVVEFTITKEGNVSSVFIIESANELYDKEAVRLVRELNFASPAYRNEEAQPLCIRLPILFNPLLFCKERK